MNQHIEKDTRTRVLEALYKHGIKQIEVARQTGMHHSTLCLWLQGKIKGHHVKIEETLENWLNSLQANKPNFSKNATTKLFGSKTTESKEPGGDGEGARHSTRTFNVDEDLIPIRLDIESEGIRFKENICWNMHEPYLTPEAFAKSIADENGLPANFENEISIAIKKSIQAFRRYTPMQLEMIRVIELDIRIDNVCLKDRFEWDINDPNNVPEEFALNLCNELGLNNEFMTLIAHSIREQIQFHQRDIIDRTGFGYKSGEDFAQLKKSTRSLLESGLQQSKKKIFEQILITEDNCLRGSGGEYLYERDELNKWEPRIEILDYKDIERMEKLEDRKIRYEKRRR